MARHDDAAKEWGALGSWEFIPSAISYEPKINSRKLQGERTRARARQDIGTSKSGAEIVGDSQGGGVRGKTINGEDVLERRMGQVKVLADPRTDVSAHEF